MIINRLPRSISMGIKILTAAIAGVGVPATGDVPTSTITATTEYTATISWSGSPANFASATIYTATITITPKPGYTLSGVPANFFTVSGATCTNAINAGVVSAVFPVTATTISTAGITGITVPATDGTPVASIDNTQYTGTIAWSPNDNPYFESTIYTATITLTAKAGYTLVGVSANFFSVAGATSSTNSANSGIVTTAFPATAAYTYTSAYPSPIDATTVKATVEYSSYHAHLTCDPAQSLSGTWANNQWLANNYLDSNHNRFHIDLGSAKVIKRVYYENSHDSGGDIDTGVAELQSFGATPCIYGSNDVNAFNELDFSVDTNWTAVPIVVADLDPGDQHNIEPHINDNIPDPHYFRVTNSTAYRYYCLKIWSNRGHGIYVGMRRIELQTGA